MGISNGLTYNAFWFIIGRIFLMLIIILLKIIYIYIGCMWYVWGVIKCWSGERLVMCVCMIGVYVR